MTAAPRARPRPTLAAVLGRGAGARRRRARRRPVTATSAFSRAGDGRAAAGGRRRRRGRRAAGAAGAGDRRRGRRRGDARPAPGLGHSDHAADGGRPDLRGGARGARAPVRALHLRHADRSTHGIRTDAFDSTNSGFNDDVPAAVGIDGAPADHRRAAGGRRDLRRRHRRVRASEHLQAGASFAVDGPLDDAVDRTPTSAATPTWAAPSPARCR